MNALDTQAHEAQIFPYLKRLMAEGSDGNFLIVSYRDVYVQFIRDDDATQLYGEAVSNANLPRDKQLSDAQIARLLQYGFGPPSASDNFAATFRVANEGALRDLARLTALVLADVYGCEAAQLEFELEL